MRACRRRSTAAPNAWVNGDLWVAVNERDELGGDLAPDYMTVVHQNDFYGWPYSYWGSHVDDRVKPERPDLVDIAREPDYALGPHTASLGLAWSEGTTLPARFREGATRADRSRRQLGGRRHVMPFGLRRPDA